MPFDFPALVDGLKRANVGFGGLTVRADFDLKDDRATLVATGQSFPYEGPAGERAVRLLRVRDAAVPAKTRMEPP
jgi:hypothetical protein